MIYPNPMKAPLLAPGMGYAPGARGFGYVAHMGYAPGARGLGAISATMMQTAEAAGLDPGTLATLSVAGATDTDIQNLMNGTTDLDTLYATYGISGSPSQTAAATAATPVTSAPASTAQIPPGSIFSYQVTYSQNISTPAPAQFISSFAAALSQFDYSMVSSNIVSNTALGLGSATIQFQILDSIGNNLFTDAKGNLDQISNQITYNSVTGSTVPTLVSSPSSGTVAAAAAAAPAAATSLSTWFENNAAYVGLAVLAVVAINAFGNKR
jgi:hypothetical protein